MVYLSTRIDIWYTIIYLVYQVVYQNGIPVPFGTPWYTNGIVTSAGSASYLGLLRYIPVSFYLPQHSDPVMAQLKPRPISLNIPPRPTWAIQLAPCLPRSL